MVAWQLSDRSFDLLFFLFFLLLLALQLQLLRLLFVVLAHEDQGMQGKHAADLGADVDREHHVVVLGCEAADQLLAVEVGKQIDDFLEEEHDLVVRWQLALFHIS